jgi:hypothetical protein
MEPMQASTSGPRRVLREWWWAVLLLVVALSLAVSSIGGTRAGGPDRPHAAVAQAPSGIFQTVVPLDAGHRLAVGHHVRRSTFHACVAAHPSLTTRQAQRACLTEAHLHVSTPFS